MKRINWLLSGSLSLCWMNFINRKTLRPFFSLDLFYLYTLLSLTLLHEKTITARTCDLSSTLWCEKFEEEQSLFSTLFSSVASLSLSIFFFAIFFVFVFFFIQTAFPSVLFQPCCSPSPPHNPMLSLRAARHRAVLYFSAHFSRRLVPSHADPYHAPVQCRRRWRKRVIFSPWVRTPHDKW